MEEEMVFKRVSGFQALTVRNFRGRGYRDEKADATPTQVAQQSIDKTGEKLTHLLEWDDLPPWKQHGSDHLRTGYRAESGSIRSCLHSWSYLHNETVNIFSHIIGAVLFLGLPFCIFRTEIPPRYKIATTADVVVCSIYFLGVGVCFTLSALFHTFMCHSEAVCSLGMKLDYQGILLLMWGANVPLIYYSIPCELRSQIAYWSLNTLLAGLCSVATFHPSIGGPHLGHMRAWLFATFGFCSVIAPILIGIAKHGIEDQTSRVGLPWILLTALFDGIGVVVYALKFPEQRYPRMFDLFGASHQVMHVMVVLAALTYTKAMLQAFDFYHQHGVCA
ncbi:hemolysin-III channel protein-like protein Izh2 [Hypoxylon sp. FL1284]|nr:hemolysin-III channel protein-like protein Izh2 [Hypoxylon sp. FL1284]